MRIDVHADDLGLSPGISAAILAAHDEGLLDSASVIVNGTDADAALAEARRRPRLGLAIHLNLMEGRPILDPLQVPLLVDERGELCRSFPDLWRRLAIGSRASREALAGQVRAELAAQLRRYRAGIGAGPLCVDSHQHYHLIPPVLDILLALHAEFRFTSMRTVDEPFFFHVAGPAAASAYLGPNLVKHVLLRALSARARPRLLAHCIATNDRFVGVLFTGRMTPGAVGRALASLAGREDDAAVEVLFHPGRASAQEEPLWRRADLRAFYRSERRGAEAAALHSDELRDVLARFRDPDAGAVAG